MSAFDWNQLIPSALRLFGGYGRDKQKLGSKLSGCNEWIAWCIFVESGTELSRKQISSHLQVLKKLLSDNAQCKWKRDTCRQRMI